MEFEMIIVEELYGEHMRLCHICSVDGGFLKSSTIQQVNPCGLLLSKNHFAQAETIAFTYGILVYSDV